ncbi:lysophospholipase [Sphingomonas sp. LB-2]|uniref:alpha/beta hydrolase n=1 Tax=Sphingomonas caeni TaxID=2984949 RepID=UPI00222F7826|nr:lysophospholipase [Sphingomonas caeni]MCW3849367.1 lysophospholipase [Sphingomonas caeni]
MRFRPLILALALAACTATPRPNVSGHDDPPLYAETHGRITQEPPATLILVIHDDGDPGTRSDEAAFADAVIRAVPNALAMTLLRPGSADAKGNRSSGERGTDTGDNFTLDRLIRFGRQIQEIKHRFPHANLILVGDGGGAALVADLAGLHPDLADGILLVGCPCALPEWRKHMAAKTGNPAWAAAVASLDPLKFAGGVSTDLHVAVLVGGDDAVTPVALSRAYVEALTLRGIGTDYRIVPGKGHDLLGDPETMSALTRLAAGLPEKS